MRRIHYVRDDGTEQRLPLTGRATREVRPAIPRTSGLIGAVAVVVLLAGLAVSLSLAVEAITRIPPVAAHIGTFTSPISLPGWAKIALPAAGAVAGVERSLTFRSHWLTRLGA